MTFELLIPCLLQSDPEPWFEPNRFGALVGAIGGGVGGTLGGLVGAFAGWAVPRGKARGVVLGLMGLFFGIGLACLALLVYALIEKQPYGIWFPFALLGSVFTVVFGILRPVMKRRYQQVEQRRIEAEGLRAG